VVLISVNEDRPIYVAEAAAESTDRKWINKLPHPRDNENYKLKLVWQGRYRSNARFNDLWRKMAQPWRPGDKLCSASSHCIDDSYDDPK